MIEVYLDDRRRPRTRGRILAVAVLAGLGIAPAVHAEPAVSEVQVRRQHELTRISLTLSEAITFRAHVLGAPYRVVLDLPKVDWRLDKEARTATSPVTAWRYGSVSKDVMRVVFDVDRPVRVRQASAQPPAEKGKAWQLVIDLEQINKGEFAKLLREQRGTLPDYTAPGDDLGESQRAGPGAPLIVIDPGHGGIDPGTTGRGGTQEKDIVLLIARELREQALASGRYRVLLTRGADHYVPLRRRFEIARSAGAHLFISLHADSSPLRASRGLSIYTLSNRASDDEAAALARRENRSDIVAGVDISSNSDRVAGILIDLAQRQSLHQAHRLAGSLVEALRGKAELAPKPLRAAGFLVLKAPDIPSVLLELGHLSNTKDEHQMRDPAYRHRLAETLLQGIDGYFSTRAKKPERGAEAESVNR